MLKPKTVLILGLWILLVVFLSSGLPTSWQSALYILTGLYLVLRFLVFKIRHASQQNVKNLHDTFVENGAEINSPRQ